MSADARRHGCEPWLRLWLFAVLLVAGFSPPAFAGIEGLTPAQRSDFFVDLFELPLEQRILPAPESVVELVWLRNRRAKVDFRPTPASLTHPLIPRLQHVIRTLPEPVYRLASRHLAAIFVVEHNFGSGRAEGLWDPAGQLVGGYMLLNLSALSQPANAWATMRENSAFHTHGGDMVVEVTLASSESDSVEDALRFIVLHELGHVLGMGLGIHGHWAVPSSWPITRDSAFSGISWRAGAHELLYSPAKQANPLLTQLQFYRFEAAPLPRSAAPEVYRQLARTDFPSLYGTLDPYEDFAETFAIFVHTRLLLKPYGVAVRAGERVVERYHSCLQTGDCPTKALLIERLLARQPMAP